MNDRQDERKGSGAGPHPTDREDQRPRPADPVESFGRLRNPSHFSRNSFQLVFLVGLLFLVIYAMMEARKPENWAWMGFADPTTVAPIVPDGEVQINVPKSSATAAADSDPSLPTENETKWAARWRSTGSARSLFWDWLLDQLNQRQKVELFRMLRELRDLGEISLDNQSSLRELIRLLSDKRQRFHALLLEWTTNQESSEAARAKYVDQLFALQQIWSGQLQPLLEKSAAGATLSSEETTELQTLWTILEASASSRVRDRTLLGREAEGLAWMFFLDQALRTEGSVDPIPVPMVQLLAQPEVYRGKWVPIEGTLVRARALPAQPNPLGVETYFELWIRPSSRANVPYCVYVLELPDAFPQLTGRLDALEEPIEMTGLLFKLRVFQSTDGSAECPLLVARSFPWQPGDSAAPRPTSATVSRTMLWAALGLAIVAGWFVARTVYRTTSQRRPVRPAQDRRALSRLDGLKDDDSIKSITEKLNEMSE